MAKVNINQAALDSAMREMKRKLQEQVNSAVQTAARKVRDAYNGESEEHVFDALVAQIAVELGPELSKSFNVNDTTCRQVAAAIVRGELED